MAKNQSILDKNLSKGKAEVNLSTFAVLFSEIIAYVQQRVKSGEELHDKLVSLGRFIGIRMLDLIVLREKGYKRETKLLGMLMFLKSTIWKNLFGKEADRLERSNDNPRNYHLIEKEPLVNTYISVPKDNSLNCAAFSAGIIEAMLEASNFPCKVSAHWHEGATTYLIEFDESVIDQGLNFLMKNFRRLPRFSNIRRQSSAASKFVPKQITTLPVFLHNHLFPNVEVPSTASNDAFSKKLEILEKPVLRNANLLQHFEAVAREKTDTYSAYMDEMMQWNLEKLYKLLPKEFNFRTGWTRYDHQTGEITEVSHPLESCSVFDVEVCVTDAEPKGKLPTMAIALTSKAWYSWCSKRLVENTPYYDFATTNEMIPLSVDGEDRKARLVVGHNVGFDRARTREPYLQYKTGLRYFDTLSAGASIYGMADHQQGLYNKDDLTEEKTIFRKDWAAMKLEKLMAKWRTNATKVSLKDLCKFLLSEDKDRLSKKISMMKKTERDYFVKEPIMFFRETKNFQECMAYCALDVIATAKAFQKLVPKFREMYPSPVTLYGFLNMGDAYLPINRYWPQYYDSCEKALLEQKQQNSIQIVKSAKTLCEETNITDPWLWTEDWKLSRKDSNPRWYNNLFANAEQRALSIEDIGDDTLNVRYGKLIPKIFGMVYGPYPLYDHPVYGWGYLIPVVNECREPDDFVELGKEKSKVLMPAGALWNIYNERFGFAPKELLVDLSVEENLKKIGPFYYKQLEKASGHKSTKIATPFALTYKSLLGRLLKPTRFQKEFNDFVSDFFTTKFWISYSKRFADEIHVWQPEASDIELPSKTDSKLENATKLIGALAPGIRPAGTVSRRAVHALWVTMTNVKDEKESRIGTHLKSMVQAPPGYCIVGADVDSQEQWLAAIMGDASDAAGLDQNERRPGRTPFSNMALAGHRSDNSDLHSVIANDLKIKRDTAKILNYARLYGAGITNAKNTLMLRKLKQSVIPFFLEFCKVNGLMDSFVRAGGQFFVPTYSLDDDDGSEKPSSRLFEEWLIQELRNRGFSISDSTTFKPIPEIYENFSSTEKYFIGGYESSTFNYLVWSARQGQMCTPVLKCILGSGLSIPQNCTGTEKQLFLDTFMRSRMNWVVQSSAVDFLHLLLLSMDWLCTEYDIGCRFMISIHDEVRYLCKDEDVGRCALALMWSNAYVRATISQAIGIQQLPMNIAFFSEVDVDSVLRKSVTAPCKNPDGTVPKPGESWNMEMVLEKTDGKLSKGTI
ncbi:unnamed protein product, partial [Mesorhabditis belari]|uniref:Trafficking protein particle complex subunit 5 n=1 Tax=Mesorhabditis belari TaxID=2138241 RepID=A0AAF3EF37_9BILA